MLNMLYSLSITVKEPFEDSEYIEEEKSGDPDLEKPKEKQKRVQNKTGKEDIEY